MARLHSSRARPTGTLTAARLASKGRFLAAGTSLIAGTRHAKLIVDAMLSTATDDGVLASGFAGGRLATRHVAIDLGVATIFDLESASPKAGRRWSGCRSAAERADAGPPDARLRARLRPGPGSCYIPAPCALVDSGRGLAPWAAVRARAVGWARGRRSTRPS